MKSRTVIFVVVILTMAFALTACRKPSGPGSDSPAESAQTIQMEQTLEIGEGESGFLHLAFGDEDGQSPQVQVSCDNSDAVDIFLPDADNKIGDGPVAATSLKIEGLSAGTATVNISTPDGKAKGSCTVTVTKAQPGLTGISSPQGALSPVFDPSVTQYKLIVPAGTGSADLSLQFSSFMQSVQVDGQTVNGTCTVNLPSSTSKKVKVTVTTKYGEFKDYEITISKATETSSGLRELSLSSLQFTFSPAVYQYQLVLPKNGDPQTTVNLNAVPENDQSTVFIDGEEKSSGSFAVGASSSRRVVVKVVSKDKKTIQFYTVTLTGSNYVAPKKTRYTVFLSPSLQFDNKGYGDYGTEKDRMHQVADVTEKILENHGITVYRNNDSLNAEIEESITKKPDVHVALHSNSWPGGMTRGIETWYWESGTEGEKLAKCIHSAVMNIYPGPSRDARSCLTWPYNLKEVRLLANQNIPTCLCEMGFHDNKDDATWIIGHIDEMGTAVAKGILAYLNVPY